MDFNIIAQEQPITILNEDAICLLQAIEVMFNTSTFDVFNTDEDEFVNLKQYVFKTKISAESLQSKITDIINATIYIPSDWSVEVNVYFIEGSLEDIGVIDVRIENIKTSEKYNQLYSFR